MGRLSTYPISVSPYVGTKGIIKSPFLDSVHVSDLHNLEGFFVCVYVGDLFDFNKASSKYMNIYRNMKRE